ncbi:MAG TPA: hypothetical protein VFD92_04160 [Candidatus Binatia bacterium]|nr:hypothetical protein [Candidatus Binatia bacterium]
MDRGEKRLSISTKMFVVAASFALPIAVLVYFVVANINETIDFARWELMGNAYQRPLESLMQGLLKVDVATHRCAAGASDCDASVKAASAQVNRAFDALEGVDREVGTDLQFTEEGLGKRDRSHLRVANVRAEWQRVAASIAGGSSPAVDEQMDHLVADVRGMITHAGDTSNLILDPDLDSYYLMDVTLLALPQTQDRIAKTTILGGDLLRSGITPEDRTKLAVQAALLKESDLDRIVASSQTSLNEDANFYGTSATLRSELKPALARYQAAATRFIDMTAALAAPGAASVDSAAYTAAGVEALDASFQMWNVAVQELDRLLEARIATRVQARTRALTLAAIALVIASFLAYVTARSISRPLDALVQTLGPGATLLGQCVASIAEASQRESTTPEEAAIICEELNAHCEDMRRAAAELTAQVKGGRVGVSSESGLGTPPLEPQLGTA